MNFNKIKKDAGFGIPSSSCWSSSPGRAGALGLTLLLTLAACSQAPTPQKDKQGRTAGALVESQSLFGIKPTPIIDPARELVITDLSVTEDPVRTTYVSPEKKLSNKAGVWSFGRLMEQMAGGKDASALVLSWLSNWEQDQNVNGFSSPARASIRSLVTDPWLVASGCAAGASDCQLDFSKAPFRLLAVTNRLDLRQVQAQALKKNGKKKKPVVVNAGEGRFSFEVIGPTGNPLAFSVILEYRQKATSNRDIKKLARAWHKLGSMPFGEDYNAALQALTLSFAGQGVMPERPNGSAINQVRTNEASLAPAGSDPNNPPAQKLWEMREFNLGADGSLHQVTVKENPDLSLNGSQALADFLNANQLKANQGAAGPKSVPDAWLGAGAITPANLAWSAPGASEDARHTFAINTCGGCHKSETGTNFLHFGRRVAGQATPVSDWLANTDTPRRVADLAALLGKHGAVSGPTTSTNSSGALETGGSSDDEPVVPSNIDANRVH